MKKDYKVGDKVRLKSTGGYSFLEERDDLHKIVGEVVTWGTPADGGQWIGLRLSDSEGDEINPYDGKDDENTWSFYLNEIEPLDAKPVRKTKAKAKKGPYTVQVIRTESYAKIVEVEATSEKEAEQVALSKAGDIDFHSEGTSYDVPDYTAQVI